MPEDQKIVACGEIVLCICCTEGNHDLCIGDVEGLACDLHGDPISCKCHCCAHPSNREAVKQRNQELGLLVV